VCLNCAVARDYNEFETLRMAVNDWRTFAMGWLLFTAVGDRARRATLHDVLCEHACLVRAFQSLLDQQGLNQRAINESFFELADLWCCSHQIHLLFNHWVFSAQDPDD
jgi:hypothetical protein